MERVVQVLVEGVVSTWRKVVSGMERVVQVLVEGVVSTWRKVVSGMTAFCRSERVRSMAEVAKRLVEGVVSMWRKVVSGMTAFRRSESGFSMAEEVAKRLAELGLEVLLFGALKRFLVGSGGIASVAIFILDIIIDLGPWKKDCGFV